MQMSIDAPPYLNLLSKNYGICCQNKINILGAVFIEYLQYYSIYNNKKICECDEILRICLNNNLYRHGM